MGEQKFVCLLNSSKTMPPWEGHRLLVPVRHNRSRGEAVTSYAVSAPALGSLTVSV